MTADQIELFDRRADLARHHLGLSIWFYLVGDDQAAAWNAERANAIDAELRRMCGL